MPGIRRHGGARLGTGRCTGTWGLASSNDTLDRLLIGRDEGFTFKIG